MKLFATFLLSIATLSAAKPYPANFEADEGALEKRATIVSVTCPRLVSRSGRVNEAKTYSVREIQTAFDIATGLLSPPPDFATGKNGKDYPAYYSNFENIPLPADCTAAGTIDQREYPILRGGVPFGDGSDAGPDRIIFARQTQNRYTYCYTVYHQDGTADDGDGAGAFAQCT